MSRSNSRSTKDVLVAMSSDAKSEKSTKTCDPGKRPPVDYSSVTDDRHAVDAKPKCVQPPGCLPNGCIKTEQHFACDRQLVKTLAQYVSPDERRKVFMWLDVLGEMTLDDDELSDRSMYVTCLLLLLKSGQLVPPFTRVPPPRPLKTLRDVIDKRLFKKVQIECRKRRLYERVHYEHPDRSVAQRPCDFYNDMPTPRQGIFCYGAAFSTLQWILNLWRIIAIYMYMYTIYITTINII